MNITINENTLRLLALIPITLTTVVKNRVKKVKLNIKPATTPKGLRLPPTTELDNTIGNMGNIQGDKMVTIPPMNAKIKSSNILFNIF